ncbi:MAG: hypothetical protein HY505_01900 [Candidatus Yanofskybacteria bacterium]|nr:hypothetical protein [Candidatus Yanofskybacteria bacterium]
MVYKLDGKYHSIVCNETDLFGNLFKNTSAEEIFRIKRVETNDETIKFLMLEGRRQARKRGIKFVELLDEPDTFKKKHVPEDMPGIPSFLR